jgi:hypothetical protein
MRPKLPAAVRALLLLLPSLAPACGSSPPAPQAPPAPTEAPLATPGTSHRVPVYGPPHSTGPSYEAALDTPENISALAGEPTLTDQDLAGPMRNPSFMSDCNAPDSMHVKVQVAVRDGAAIGVTVRTDPDDTTVAECIEKAVRGLQWTPSKRRDSMTTVY